MNKFIFKLEAVLKIKEFNVKKIKITLGQILIKIGEYEEQIVALEKDIKQAYSEQELLMNSIARADFVRFFANLVNVKRVQITQTIEKLKLEKKNYQDCVALLAKARGEVKIFEKIRHRKWELYKKQMIAKSYLEIEENNNIHHQVTLKNSNENGNKL